MIFAMWMRVTHNQIYPAQRSMTCIFKKYNNGPSMLLILQLDDFERIIFSFRVVTSACNGMVPATYGPRNFCVCRRDLCCVLLENAQHNIWLASTQLVCPLSDVSNYGEWWKQRHPQSNPTSSRHFIYPQVKRQRWGKKSSFFGKSRVVWPLKTTVDDCHDFFWSTQRLTWTIWCNLVLHARNQFVVLPREIKWSTGNWSWLGEKMWEGSVCASCKEYKVVIHAYGGNATQMTTNWASSKVIPPLEGIF